MSYLVVGLFDNLLGPLLYLFCDMKFFGYAVCSNSAIARKGAMPYLKVIYSIPIVACLATFEQKGFLLIQFYKAMLLFYFDLFLNLGFYYI